MSTTRWSILFLALSALLTLGCPDTKIDDKSVAACASGSTACSADADCPDRHVCKRNKTTGANCCVRVSRTCATPADCCPGQSCRSGACVDSFEECPSDGVCSGAGRVCETWTDPVLGQTSRCTSQRCGPTGECPDGLGCVNSFCVATNPCGGSCPEGTACVPQTNACHPLGERCALPPKPGHILTLTAPDALYDTCVMSQVGCQYSELLPLRSNDLGRHASVAALNGTVSVAHYDGQHGDLVVSDFDADGKLRKSTWVDGVPADQPVVAGPSGPRGGISAPGDDVGRYTDVAFRADGSLLVAYYDVTHGDLKVAERAPDGTWGAPVVVDGAKGDVGLYASLAFDAAGKPAVAYFQRAGLAGSGQTCGTETVTDANRPLLTAVKLARAKVERPAGPADWALETVACGLRPEPACFGCAADQVCVTDAAAPSGTRCATPSNSCTGTCGTSGVCVAQGSGAGCAKARQADSLNRVPPGVGLFPSLAFKGDLPVIAWYDQLKGNAVVSHKPDVWKQVVLDGQDSKGVDTGNVGLFPALSVDAAGTLHLAYHDASRRGLRYWSGATIAAITDAAQARPPSSAYVDAGKGTAELPDPDGIAFVGSDAALLNGTAGVFAAYQNATRSDLKLAVYRDNLWKPLREWSEGAVGFYADVAEMGGKLYLVHARLHARSDITGAQADNSLRLEVVQP